MNRIFGLMAALGIVTGASAQTRILDYGIDREFMADFDGNGTVTSADYTAWDDLFDDVNNPDADQDGDTDLDDGDLDGDGDVDLTDGLYAYMLVYGSRLPEDHVAIYTDAVGRINSKGLESLDGHHPWDIVNGHVLDSYRWTTLESIADISTHADSFGVSSPPTTEWEEHQAFIYDLKSTYTSWGFGAWEVNVEYNGLAFPLGVALSDTNYDYVSPDTMLIGFETLSDNPWKLSQTQMDDIWDEYEATWLTEFGNLNDFPDQPTLSEADYFLSTHDTLVVALMSSVYEVNANADTSPSLVVTNNKYAVPEEELLGYIEEEVWSHPIAIGAYVPDYGVDNSQWFSTKPMTIVRDSQTVPNNTTRFPAITTANVFDDGILFPDDEEPLTITTFPTDETEEGSPVLIPDDINGEDFFDPSFVPGIDTPDKYDVERGVYRYTAVCINNTPVTPGFIPPLSPGFRDPSGSPPDTLDSHLCSLGDLAWQLFWAPCDVLNHLGVDCVSP